MLKELSAHVVAMLVAALIAAVVVVLLLGLLLVGVGGGTILGRHGTVTIQSSGPFYTNATPPPTTSR